MTRAFRVPMLALALSGCTVDTATDDDDSALPAERCGPEAAVGLEVGLCAPDFTLPDRYGAPFSLHKQRGKVALVDISAIW